MNPISVVKANGDVEPFKGDKLMQSLIGAGASTQIANDILALIESGLRNGMSTASIYRRAFVLLHKREKTAALRYSLRKALLELGPSGFPFERFVGELFRSKGFEVKNDQIIQGKCVEHEVDIVATNKEKHVLAELKFHNERGLKTDLKVALYVDSRFKDIPSIDGKGHPREGWLITNTKFSRSAIQYGECADLTLVGWNYPAKGNLRDMVEESGMHPITCLPSLTRSQKKAFISQNVVLCRDVLQRKDILEHMGVSADKMKKIEEEVNILCHPTQS